MTARLVLPLLLLAGPGGILLGDVTREQRRELRAAKDAISKAGRLYQKKKYKESAALVRASQKTIEKLASNEDRQLRAQLAVQHKRLVRAHALLELQGIDLPRLKKFTELREQSSRSELLDLLDSHSLAMITRVKL